MSPPQALAARLVRRGSRAKAYATRSTSGHRVRYVSER
jgi:hypothetical protein